MTDLAKAHIKGYSKRDGTYVKPHERGDEGPGLVPHHHPKPGEDGNPVVVHHPHHASAPSTWHNPDAVATFVPGGDVPLSINGIPVKKWRDHPRTVEGWDYTELVNDGLEEPPFILPPGKKPAAGVVIQEKDGRVWVVHPTNSFGGYQTTWPKGTVEDGLSLQASACKEAYEESGLKVRIIGFIGDFDRTTSKARMYLAERVSGDPTDVTWESQAVSLCPRGHLYSLLNMWPDHGIAEQIGAGPAPVTTKPGFKNK